MRKPFGVENDRIGKLVSIGPVNETAKAMQKLCQNDRLVRFEFTILTNLLEFAEADARLGGLAILRVRECEGFVPGLKLKWTELLSHIG